ncbi:MAG: UDP-N-acetylglucosamine 1-carboxyvinyltransferase [Alphaproteobacteria bacterium]|nr:MAG: UDP-N-acetylglucosamine 1-carboxyvinyltransferase [Alphaproteobacteria bacterium]
MDFYQVNGGYNFRGKIRCGGAKNLATKVIIASLLSDEISVLENVPNIGDVLTLKKMLTKIGVEWDFSGGTMSINPKTMSKFNIDHEDGIIYGRLTMLLIPALLLRNDLVSVPKMDGCKFGTRSVNFFFEILKQFNIEIEESEFLYHVKKIKPLKGQKIHLKFPSVGATEFAIMLCALAEGTSIIQNAAQEPEISCLISFMQRMGSRIHWIDEKTIYIEGVKKLHGSRYKIINDRIEAASWAVLAACSDGDIEVEDVIPDHLITFLGIYQRMGGGFSMTQRGIRFFRQEPLKSILVECGPYPVFSTDYQPLITLMMTQASGISAIHETIFNERLSHLANLKNFGVKAELTTGCIGNECKFSYKNYYHSAFIVGPTQLVAPSQMVLSENLRSGIAYLLAGCVAQGQSKIGNIHFISRGYENILEKLQSVNVDINLLNDLQRS